MTQQTTVYFTAPTAVRTTQRYERLFHHVSHHFSGDEYEIIEARKECPTATQWRKAWPAMLQRIDTLVFMLNDEGCLGHGTWTEVCQVRQARKKVFLAQLTSESELVLVEWQHLEFTLNKLSQRNYARIAERGTARRKYAEKAGEVRVL